MISDRRLLTVQSNSQHQHLNYSHAYNSVPAAPHGIGGTAVKQHEETKWAKDSLSISPVRHRGGDGLDTESNMSLNLKDKMRRVDNQYSRREESKGEFDDGYDHLIFDIEEVECKMTDIEER